MKKRIIKVGLASYGMSGKVFQAPVIQAAGGFEITHILERSKNLSAVDLPKATIVRTFEELIRSEVEVVIINTPDKMHYPMAKEALLAGKNVVIEKPFATTVEECKELIAIAQEQKKILTVYQNRRLDNGFRTIQKILKEKYLGDIVEFESRFDRYKDHIAEGSWKEDPSNTYSLLYNLGPHLVDQAIALFGTPLAVTARLAEIRPGSKTNDYFHLRLDYPHMTALLRASYLTREATFSLAIHGTKGSYVKYGVDPQEEKLKQGSLPGGPYWGKESHACWGILNTSLRGIPYREPIESLPGCYPEFYRNLYKVITQDEELMVKPEESLIVIQVLEAAIESHLQMRSIPLF